MLCESITPSPRVLDVKRTYYQQSGDKPKGLWLSPPGEDSWLSWCKAEQFEHTGLNHRYTAEVLEDRLLVIRDVETFDRFEDEYLVRGREFIRSLKGQVDWPRVAAQYGGIAIVPYLWQRRMGSLWYYGWDCASVCVWDLAAIHSWREDVAFERA